MPLKEGMKVVFAGSYYS